MPSGCLDPDVTLPGRYSEIDLSSVARFPAEVTREAFRYALAFAYSAVQIPEVHGVRDGRPPHDDVGHVLDFFGASDALRQAIEWRHQEKLADVPSVADLAGALDAERLRHLLEMVAPSREVLRMALRDTCAGLHGAAVQQQSRRRAEVVELLLEYLADEDVMHVDSDDCGSALIWAVENGYTETVKLLLERVTDDHVMHVTDVRHSALFVASFEDYPEIFKMVLGRVKDDHVMRVYGDGFTALRVASGNGHAEMVAVMLERVTDEHVMHADDGGHTALIGASVNGHSHIVALLLERVTNGHVMHADGAAGTALMFASSSGHGETVRLLLERVTDEHVLHKNDDGDTAMSLASRHGHDLVVEMLQGRVEQI